MQYKLVDCKTGQILTTSTDRKRLQRRADKLDLIYGAVRYVVRPIWN